MSRHERRGYGLIGLLVAVAILVVLFAVMMNGLNQAFTGQGNPESGTVRSFEDKLTLEAIMQGMAVWALDHRERYPVPSEISGSGDRSEDITANFYSLLIAQGYVRPENLISGNEYSGYVEIFYDYDYAAYDPATGTFWDPGFKADLHDLSHTSFAHMPLYGERFDRRWSQSFSSTFPLIGNRGPRDGVTDPISMTHGRDGSWGGHLAFGDGHVEWVEAFVRPNLLLEIDGVSQPDNVYAMEEGANGGDAILSFTKSMGRNGPELQWD